MHMHTHNIIRARTMHTIVYSCVAAYTVYYAYSTGSYYSLFIYYALVVYIYINIRATLGVVVVVEQNG